MLNKKEVKDIQSLGHKKHRDETGYFIAEGPKIVAELVQLVPDYIVKVYATGDWISNNEAILKNIVTQEVTQMELEKLSQLQTPHHVLCVLKQFEKKEPVIENNFCLYLDTIQDPGNFGTIIRIADWFGISNIVCTQGCADMYNAKVVQATMASIARVNVFYDAAIDWLPKQKVPLYAAVLKGKSLYEYNKITSGILLIGNESKGLEPALQELATERITIPKKGAAESLNAAVATGIILSHLIG